MAEKNGARFLSPAEIVAGVFHFLPKKHLNSRPRDMHPVFYELRQKGLSVLSDFRFDVRDVYPYSDTLERAISNLLDSKIILFSGSHYEADDSLKRYFEGFVAPNLSQKQIQELKTIAKALSKFCS